MEKQFEQHVHKMHSLVSILKNNRYRFLLFALIITLTVPPFLKDTGLWNLSMISVLTILLLACMNFLSGLKRIFIVALAAFFFSGIMGWVSYFIDLRATNLTRCVFNLFFFGLVFYHLLKEIRYSEVVTSSVIYGSIAAYFLLGIIGGNLFFFLDLLYPGSYNITMNTQMANFFSFTTLTTVGYGNVFPVKSQAQAISSFFAIAGQLYLTILVAILVGKYLLYAERKEK